jgi:predicted SprT family Zn-dependent metalloprotease
MPRLIARLLSSRLKGMTRPMAGVDGSSASDHSCDSLAAVMAADRVRRLSEFRAFIRSWLVLWGRPGFDEHLAIEWSSRLHRSLGRAFPELGLVKLSPVLLTARRALALEVVCHEIAHIVVPQLHRGRCLPHGDEWAQLVRVAGFPPRIRVPFPGGAGARGRAEQVRVPMARGANERRYIHTCPVCHMRRLAKRRVTRWRCAACVAIGLDGRLTIMEARSR